MLNRWTIRGPIEVRSRVKVQSGQCIHAWFDAWLIPDGDQEGIEVILAWDDPSDSKWSSAVNLGVSRFVDYRIEQERPVGNTFLVMRRIVKPHPIGTNENTIQSRIYSELSTKFKENEILI